EQARADSGQAGRGDTARLIDIDGRDRLAGDIGLELKPLRGPGAAARSAQPADRDAGALDPLDVLPKLEGCSLEDGLDEFPAAGSQGQADDRPGRGRVHPRVV